MMTGAVKRKAETSAVPVPVDLDALGKAKLIALVQALDAERSVKKAKPQTQTPPAAAAAAPAFNATAVEKMKKALAKKAVAAIKKTKITSNSSKPWAEVHEGMTLDQAKILIGE